MFGEFETVMHQVTELPNFRRGDKDGLYHAAHEQIINPFGILEVSFIPFLRLGYFGCARVKNKFFRGC